MASSGAAVGVRLVLSGACAEFSGSVLRPKPSACAHAGGWPPLCSSAPAAAPGRSGRAAARAVPVRRARARPARLGQGGAQSSVAAALAGRNSARRSRRPTDSFGASAARAPAQVLQLAQVAGQSCCSSRFSASAGRRLVAPPSRRAARRGSARRGRPMSPRPLAQRREVQPHHVEPVHQVGAEGASRTRASRSWWVAAITRTSTRDQLAAADAEELAFGQHAQQGASASEAACRRSLEEQGAPSACSKRPTSAAWRR